MLEIRRRWMTPLFIPSQCIWNGDGCLDSSSIFPSLSMMDQCGYSPAVYLDLIIHKETTSKAGAEWREERRCWLCIPGAGCDSGVSPLGFVSNPQQLGGSGLGTAHKRLADDHNPTPNTLLPHAQLQTDAWKHTNCSKDCAESVKRRQNRACVYFFKARRSDQSRETLAIRMFGEVLCM